MSLPHLTSLEIAGFKKFDHLIVEDIGQFNLIVGQNNSGKTSLLEALLLEDRVDNFAYYLESISGNIRKFKNLNEAAISIYFSSHNIGTGSTPKMLFKQIHNSGFLNISIQKDSFNNFSWSSRENEAFPEKYPAANLGNVAQDEFYSVRIPYLPFGQLYSNDLTKQYSENIQLFVNKKRKLIESLAAMVPSIENIEVSTTYSRDPILLISENDKNILSPLASFGDGTIKYFRLLLSLLTSEVSNRLMIDEVDTGIHYSRLKKFLSSLIQVSTSEKKQIFATTHSKECIVNFKSAVKEAGMEEKARIIRLAETANGIKAYTIRYEEFESAIQADSELR